MGNKERTRTEGTAAQREGTKQRHRQSENKANREKRNRVTARARMVKHSSHPFDSCKGETDDTTRGRFYPQIACLVAFIAAPDCWQTECPGVMGSKDACATEGIENMAEKHGRKEAQNHAEMKKKRQPEKRTDIRKWKSRKENGTEMFTPRRAYSGIEAGISTQPDGRDVRQAKAAQRETNS